MNRGERHNMTEKHILLMLLRYTFQCKYNIWQDKKMKSMDAKNQGRWATTTTCRRRRKYEKYKNADQVKDGFRIINPGDKTSDWIYVIWNCSKSEKNFQRSNKTEQDEIEFIEVGVRRSGPFHGFAGRKRLTEEDFLRQSQQLRQSSSSITSKNDDDDGDVLKKRKVAPADDDVNVDNGTDGIPVVTIIPLVAVAAARTRIWNDFIV